MDGSWEERFSARILERLHAENAALKKKWQESGPVRHFWIDNLLEEKDAIALASEFPDASKMMLRSSLRERKRVGVKVTEYSDLVRAGLYVFHRPEILRAVQEITGIRGLESDPSLYASGLSVMREGDFLNPHIDNSHDGDGRLYRSLNLLYYVSPGWKAECGGNLEVWDADVKNRQEIENRFNRLVVMETHKTSWHSVNKVRVAAPRMCYSNYYFAPSQGEEYRHVTTFTGRPEEPLKRALLSVWDGFLLNFLGRNFPFLLKRTKHRVKPPRKD